MTRYIMAGWGHQDATNLLTIPDDYSKPDRWSNELLASVRGEINFRLTEPKLSERLVVRLDELRREIEVEMRKRLDVKESPEEYAARCLFHASKIDYDTGKREARSTHVRRF